MALLTANADWPNSFADALAPAWREYVGPYTGDGSDATGQIILMGAFAAWEYLVAGLRRLGLSYAQIKDKWAERQPVHYYETIYCWGRGRFARSAPEKWEVIEGLHERFAERVLSGEEPLIDGTVSTRPILVPADPEAGAELAPLHTFGNGLDGDNHRFAFDVDPDPQIETLLFPGTAANSEDD